MMEFADITRSLMLNKVIYREVSEPEQGIDTLMFDVTPEHDKVEDMGIWWEFEMSLDH
jgi:hypothetical protein